MYKNAYNQVNLKPNIVSDLYLKEWKKEQYLDRDNKK
jgi:hypothetical protein